MYPLATYLREIRQDWLLPAIQSALADLAHLPYQHVAVAGVRAALDTTVTHPRGIRKVAEAERRGGKSNGPDPLCRVCRRPHDPARPGEHVAPPSPETATRGAAAVRAALTAARRPDAEEPR